MARGWILLAVWLMAGCQVSELTRLETEIRRLADAPCGRDDECGALPLGAKACGGPAFFVPYSVNADTTRLLELAARHRRLSRERLEVERAIGDCRVETPPPVACLAGRCRFTDSTGTAAEAPAPAPADRE